MDRAFRHAILEVLPIGRELPISWLKAANIGNIKMPQMESGIFAFVVHQWLEEGMTLDEIPELNRRLWSFGKNPANRRAYIENMRALHVHHGVGVALPGERKTHEQSLHRRHRKPMRTRALTKGRIRVFAGDVVPQACSKFHDMVGGDLKKLNPDAETQRSLLHALTRCFVEIALKDSNFIEHSDAYIKAISDLAKTGAKRKQIVRDPNVQHEKEKMRDYIVIRLGKLLAEDNAILALPPEIRYRTLSILIQNFAGRSNFY